MPRSVHRLLAGLVAAAIVVAADAAWAGNDPALDAGLGHLEHRWAHIKYQVTDSDAQYQDYKALAAEAAALVRRYPTAAGPLIWNGIIVSSEAGVAGAFDALGLAGDARDMFVAAGKIDDRALHGAVPTSLGSLYYLVPGFPLGFGDDDKARRFLEQGVAIDPDGLDSNYFYGDFLARQGEYAKARGVLTRALAAPLHPDRPVWDAGRRREIRGLLARVDRKLAAGG